MSDIALREGLAFMLWNELLEETGSTRLRTLGCGCLVGKDAGYLDLYRYENDRGLCPEEYQHRLVHLLHADTDLVTDEILAELREAFVAYLDGWPENDVSALLARFDRLADVWKAVEHG